MKRLFFVLYFITVTIGLASSPIREDLPKVFIDCRWCDLDFIREKVTFVNIVLDRFDSDIQVIQTRQRTGSGGREFTLIFIGRNDFKGINDTLKYFTNRTDTEDTERGKFISVLKKGLFRFIYKTPLADRFQIKYIEKKESEASKSKVLNDKWDYWVFRSSLRTFLNAQRSQKFNRFWGSFSAARVTEEWKIRFFYSTEYNESIFDYNDTKIVNITRSHRIYSSVIKSLSDHWSAGFWVNANSSTYRNIDLSVSAAPGIEYNIYPYSETNVRRFKFDYRIWAIYNNYTDMTIYFKNDELLWRQRLNASFELIRDWGSIGIGVTGKAYLHDINKNSVEVNAELNLQLIKGLSLDIYGGYEAVHDQLSLPYVDASLEEVLFQRRELETQFNYHFSVGFSYTFGSIYNNIVNTRFDN